MLKIIAMLVFGWALYAQASAETRIDTFSKDGQRDGYLIVNPQTGRIDQFDRQSNRLGYDQVSPSGRVDLYDKNSNRAGYGTVTPSRDNGNGSKR